MENYYCDICDKTIKKTYKNKHSKTRLHKNLAMSIIKDYHVKNPEFFEIENILKKHVLEFIKKFDFFIIICGCKIYFDDRVMHIKSNNLSNIQNHLSLKRCLIKCIDDFESRGDNFSHIEEMKIRFITDLRNMTYEHYLA